MNTDSNKNKDLEIEALASLVSSFLKIELEGKRASRFQN